MTSVLMLLQVGHTAPSYNGNINDGKESIVGEETSWILQVF